MHAYLIFQLPNLLVSRCGTLVLYLEMVFIYIDSLPNITGQILPALLRLPLHFFLKSKQDKMIKKTARQKVSPTEST